MKRTLRLVTWNINGLRAVLQRLGQSVQEFLENLEADIICLQETKITRSELDQELVRPPGFDAFYSFCRHRGGYSGVVTFVRNDLPTIAAEEGLTGIWHTQDSVGHIGSLHNELSTKLVHELESEGRCVITNHQAFVLLNIYCPALSSADRLEYKLQFHALLEDRVKALREANKRVVIVGDINIAHREIDHCDPGAHRSDCSSFADHPCRKWMDDFLGLPEEMKMPVPWERNNDRYMEGKCAAKIVDVFRHLHPNQTKAFTCWNTLTGARQTNYGTRIDYILVDAVFLTCVSSCSIEAERLGSDHCPVVMSCTVEVKTDSGTNIGGVAALCAKNYVEFSGTQQSIEAFVVQSQNTIENQNTGASFTFLSASPGAFGSGKLRSKSRKNCGQQSITSYFSHRVAKRKSTSPGKLSEIEGFLADQMLSKKSAKDKVAEEGKIKWQQVLSGRPPPTPMCYCGQPTVLRSVLKANDNRGRKFYVCTKPAGEKSNPKARCNFFMWADNKGAKKPKDHAATL
ncbi:unnamed protein product [Peronospora belbahrii]|uniref:DNA-(apurinic or apyrimidinic site) endonuclease n=1 Tax=Peronospora belbahrii TaxID=622444 RepID=A0AAU9L0J0_9STRA|nr:unnamed protein product [Peronospora belbahrii]CAH0515566.1 unnamed protein product [Peronospora belbahrii]